MGTTDISNQPSASSDTPHGPAFWRSLEEYADSPAFRRQLASEFPDYDPEQIRNLSRRHFLKLAGASMALAGLTLTGCRHWPRETLAPYAKRPAGRAPGSTEQFATVMSENGIARGLLVTSFDGRPIKIEGNPQHPISKGATDAQSQASVLQLYDPDRSSRPAVNTGGDAQEVQPATFADFERFARGHFKQRTGERSASIAVLAEPSSSATRLAMQRAFAERFPQASWHEYEPINRDHELAGLRAAFGRAARPHYHLDRAKVIACFDSDLLCDHPAGLKHARHWAKGRRSADEGHMNRVHVAESRFSVTGTNADHRLPAPSSEIPKLIRALAARLGVGGGADGSGGDLNGASQFVERLAKDLQAHQGEAVVAVGPGQPESVHAMVAAINEQLGAVENTLTYTEEPLARGRTQREDLQQLIQRIHAGEIDTLLMLGTNPVYNTPGDVDFAAALQKVQTPIHLGLYYDETANHSRWHVPRAHYLESWSDGRAWDGTRSIQQPLIRPLFDGKTPSEMLAVIAGRSTTESYGLVRTTFQQQGLVASDGRGSGGASGASGASGGGFEAAWRKALHEGLVANSTLQPVSVSVRGEAVQQAMQARPFDGGLGKDQFEVTFAPDNAVFDGRFANNGWLQELPDPVTKMTWDNPALMNVSDGRQRGLESGDMVNLTIADRTLKLPVYLCPGQPRGSIGLTLGFGRTAAGHVGGTRQHSVGFDTYALRSINQPAIVIGATVKAAGGSYALASTQNSHLIDQTGQWGRRERVGERGESGKVVRDATLTEYNHNPDFAFEKGPHPAGVENQKDVPLQIYQPPSQGNTEGDPQWHEPAWETEHAEAPDVFNEPHAWGMTVDMNSCIGCNACVIACQAENNVPVVGKAQVLKGREMQWLRIDRYFKNDPRADPNAEDPEVVHQPMMCVHCENAPCEEVCPVAATVHDAEGLNVMVYNRCIGVRYCSNNCPYKVRRFNWFDFHARDVRGMDKPWLGWPGQEQRTVNEIKQMVYNPEVTVRMRGVMEKCTYCLQRIKAKEIDAKNEFAQATSRGESAESGGFWHVNDRGHVALDDGAVVTACQQACPTEAIVFGDLNQKDSAVSRMKRNNRAYGVLKELNTRPRTMHLAKIRNHANIAVS